MNDLGELQWFLSIRVLRDRATKKLWLYQDSYIEKIATAYPLSAGQKAPATPLPTEELTKYEGTTSPDSIHSYQRKISHVGYATVISRPNIARAVSKLAEFLTNPSPRHHSTANQYL